GLWLDLLLLLEDRLRSKGCGLRRGDRPVAALEPFQLLGKGSPFSGKELQLGSEVWVGGQHRAPPCFMCPRLIPVCRHSSPQRISRNADRDGMVPVIHEKSVGRVRRLYAACGTIQNRQCARHVGRSGHAGNPSQYASITSRDSFALWNPSGCPHGPRGCAVGIISAAPPPLPAAASSGPPLS